jgi:hypothetical protein
MWYMEVCGKAGQCERSAVPCSCLNGGTCAYRNVFTMLFVNECYVGETHCEAYCTCSGGYEGLDCGLTVDEMISRQDLRYIYPSLSYTRLLV